MKKVTDEFIAQTNRQCYDNLGSLYEDGAGDFETLMNMGVWQEFLNGLSGKSMLDVGCGAGDAVSWLEKHGYNVTACDLSEEMLKVARRKVGGDAKFCQLGATELNKIDNKFDGIISIHLVQHLSKTMLKKFFDSVYNLLKPDGRFLLVFTNTCYEKTGYQLDGVKDDNYIFWHKWRLEDIIPVLTKAKLRPVAMRLQKNIENACTVDTEPFVFICEKEN